MLEWTIIAFAAMGINWKLAERNILELARAEARTSIEKDLLYRQWNTGHGGVYVPVTEQTQPNPYLHVPEREITTPAGRLLTLINPAFMTHQVFTLQAESGIQSRITSLKPINPDNAADAWETNALQKFESGTPEISSVEETDGQIYMRLMRPLITQEGCLNCHASQGYQVGDVRGGISVSIPITRYASPRRSFFTSIFLGYGGVWLVGLAGVYVTFHSLAKLTVERESIAAAAHASETRLRAISDNLMDAALYVYILDEEDRLHFEYASAGIEFLTGVSPDEVINDPQKLRNIILPKYRERLDEMEKESREHLTRFEMEFQYRHAITGKLRWSLLRATPYRRLDSSTYWYAVMVDITSRKYNEDAIQVANEKLNDHMREIEQLHAELSEQALRDPLTGLYNRRFLGEMMVREVARAGRENDCVSIIVSDIDHFKRINDTHGHLVGDQFLVEIASLMKTHTRGSDIACRYGGEEFLLVLPGTNKETAKQRAELLRLICASLHIPHEGKNLNVTLSFGVATYPLHGQDAEEIIIKADKALYNSKRRGRNRVTVWDK
jgi:diguanylate cyclase (GGDEF)-like protein/PAS domain S-box-containing protein